jgi:simple sugar transport system substrate-binding protein
MMNRKIRRGLIMAFLSLFFLLSACRQASPEVVTLTPKPPADAEPSEQPEASPDPSPTADDRWCAGTDIVFFPGGSEDDAIAAVVYNGAVAAAKDLGANVKYVWSDWNPQKMVTQFVEAAATQPDGIAIMGHPGDDAYLDAVADARAQGIIVTSQNTALPSLEDLYRASGFGYVGAELYPAGYALGRESVRRFDLQTGDKALVWGLLAQAGRRQRTQGVIDALEDAGLEVVYLEIDDATNADVTAGTSAFASLVAENMDSQLVIIDHGALTAAMDAYLTAAGLGPDDIVVAGFDLSSATVDAIREGWVDLVLDQQPWLQGYLPILQICLTHNYAFTGLHIDTGAGFAHVDNVEALAELVDRQIR